MSPLKKGHFGDFLTHYDAFKALYEPHFCGHLELFQ